MDKIFVNFLPPWVETNIQPAFYDKESGSVLQQTARMYAKVQCLVRMFNKLSKETKETVDEYIAKFVELKDFVDTYFENLDVQEEINNKLDDMVEAGTLQEIIAEYLNANAMWSFDTVAEMQSASNLIDGSYAETLGYYTLNDGGAGTYKIRTIEVGDVIDGGSLIAMNDNTLVAELVIEDNEVNVKQFGAKGDGTTDDTARIQACFNSNADVFFVPEGNYKITEKLTLPLNKTLRGTNANTCVFKVTDFNDYAIQYGTSYNYGSKRGKIEDIRIEPISDSDSATYGIYLYSGCEINNVYLNRLKQGVSKTEHYIDNIILYRCHIMYCGGKENSYVVDLPSNGDAIRITQCHFTTAYNRDNYSDYLGISIKGSTGVLIDNNIINAPIYLGNCKATLINNHMEGPSTTDYFNFSNIKIINSNVDIDTLYIQRCLNKPEIEIQNETTNVGHNATVSIKNVTVSLTSLMFANYQDLSADYNIYLGRQVELDITNCFNQCDFSSTWSQTFPDTGLKIKNEYGDLTKFNNVSSLASIKSTIINTDVVIPDMPSVAVGPTNTSLNSSNTNNKIPFFESGFSNSTLYYRRVTCFDWERKLAYSISSEKSVTGITSYVDSEHIGVAGNLSNTNSFVNATVGKGLLDIIYRGSASASYDKITKLPVCMASSLIDMGSNILGVPTESRTAGDIDTFNVVSGCKRIGDNVEFVSNSLPTVGTFVKGDKCIRSTISAGGNIGWIYSGSTWISLGTYPS